MAKKKPTPKYPKQITRKQSGLRNSFSFGKRKISSLLVGFILFGAVAGGAFLIYSRADSCDPTSATFSMNCWTQTIASGPVGTVLDCSAAKGATKDSGLCNPEITKIYVCKGYDGKPHDLIVPHTFPTYNVTDGSSTKDGIDKDCATRNTKPAYKDNESVNSLKTATNFLLCNPSSGSIYNMKSGQLETTVNCQGQSLLLGCIKTMMYSTKNCKEDGIFGAQYLPGKYYTTANSHLDAYWNLVKSIRDTSDTNMIAQGPQFAGATICNDYGIATNNDTATCAPRSRGGPSMNSGYTISGQPAADGAMGEVTLRFWKDGEYIKNATISSSSDVYPGAQILWEVRINNTGSVAIKKDSVRLRLTSGVHGTQVTAAGMPETVTLAGDVPAGGSIEMQIKATAATTPGLYMVGYTLENLSTNSIFGNQRVSEYTVSQPYITLSPPPRVQNGTNINFLFMGGMVSNGCHDVLQSSGSGKVSEQNFWWAVDPNGNERAMVESGNKQLIADINGNWKLIYYARNKSNSCSLRREWTVQVVTPQKQTVPVSPLGGS